MSTYRGKEVCQGCKKSGEQESRRSKTELCEKCNESLNIGLSVNKENLTEYTLVADWVNGFSSINWYNENKKASFDKLMNDILSILDNPTADSKGIKHLIRCQSGGSVYYKIPSKMVGPLNDFMIAVDEEIRKIKNTKEIAEEEARKAVSTYKNEIFNEGVKKGQDLLFSLNNGSITMDDFNKKINKY